MEWGVKICAIMAFFDGVFNLSAWIYLPLKKHNVLIIIIKLLENGVYQSDNSSP
ncbi:hypothetical protein EaACW_0581 [Erwinia amylovora ACW56400]|uniref:Uncharacterized protein n=2 Tax=Erwinia amylovora TaxID=552 RepID=A0A831A1L2_ERWAM|nr:hypothetical protein [Erwinia amylovora]EKV55432.1 hypothetical protein EaACW_0581 [Erwinia amylovora ACW56400]CBJ47525.1 hypothetical protein EAM_2851 [Erwinia amylovora ATCC 49946]CCO77428.1 hypothetical protein BN432_0597 [Erwinia amylovora Ea356]CCO81212.1 hypothetical protein BN433_0607 [Erwinia amylovora Ea266]CCO85018.1 hypothetical protein BN434_0597 [Erwinia amylovora CFBP 2585]CCO88801.1 hypothetical protein BN435_0595 [Erwinia amylovora 01SFR-BO]CCO92559.1 hypothetical protein 